MREKRFVKGLVVSLLLVVVLGSVCKINATAGSRFKGFSKDTDTAEIDFRSEVKDVLASVGAKNAGVTMTKICEDGMTFEYSVVINLPDYINLDCEEEENLLRDLKTLSIGVEDSTVDFSFSRKEEK